jgi:signal transduction histidine kinase
MISLKNSSTLRFFLYSLACFLIITALVTTVYFLLTHNQEERRLRETLFQVEENHLPSLVSRLWVTDYQSLQEELDGLVLFRYLDRAEVSTRDGRTFFAGKVARDDLSVVSKELNYMFKDEAIPIGTLRLFINYRRMHTDLFLNTGKILALQLVLAVLMAMVMASIFHQLVGKHLTMFAQFIKEDEPKKNRRVFALERSQKHDDELQMLVNQFNAMRDRIGRYVVDLDATNTELQQLLAERNKFFSIIAHDLKSPMSGLLSLSKMFADDVETLTIKDLQNIASAMHKSSERLYALMENLLQWALMQQGVMEFSPKAHSLQELVHSGIDPLRSVSEQKHVTLQSRIPDDLVVLADAQMITTVVRNLVSNALKYSDSGGSVNIAATLDQGMVRISVQDSGMGMDQPTRNRIFSLDKKASRPGTRGEGGTGLGLFLCKQFIEQHGGKIWVESEPGKGTSVFFTLPVSA